jgi:Glyoxalase superfamily protein
MTAYIPVSRGEPLLHLTEHHGDCCPGSTVFVRMEGIDEFHREITSKGDKFLRPGIETTPGASRSFNRRLRGQCTDLQHPVAGNAWESPSIPPASTQGRRRA